MCGYVEVFRKAQEGLPHHKKTNGKNMASFFYRKTFSFCLLASSVQRVTLEFSNLMTCVIYQQKEECAKKIRELGSLPADAFDKHQKTPVKTVC